ncbi:MAG: rod shape-determining protein MreC [Pseudomonadota bacterium]
MVLVLVSVLLMIADHRVHYLESVRASLATVVYPVQYVVDAPVSMSNWLGDNLTTRATLQEENQRLRGEETVLKAQLQRYISLEMENMRLRRLLDSTTQLGDRLQVAELLAVDLDPFTRQVLINKGLQHELYIGQPVLDADGIFGQVIHTTPLNSVVMLITDPGHALPVHVNRNGLRAIAAGTGNNQKLELLYIPNNADIKAGDLLLTSGLGGTFPAGYPVGIVTEVTPDSTQAYATVYAEPKALLDQSREVMLLWTDKALPPLHSDKADRAEAKAAKAAAAAAGAAVVTPPPSATVPAALPRPTVSPANSLPVPAAVVRPPGADVPPGEVE